MKRSFIVISFLLAQAFLLFPALAGTEVGNGGNLVVCRQGETIVSAELYDYYEGRVRRDWRPDFGPKTLQLNEKIEYVLTRLGEINPNRADRLRGYFKTFFEEAEFLTGIDLVTIPDSGDGYVPRGCILKQVAQQREPGLTNSFRYTIDKDFWDVLDLNQRAGLILHEIILRELVHQEVAPHTNSIAARYLNSLFASGEITKLTLKRYIEILKKLQVQKADIQYVPILLFGPEKTTWRYDPEFPHQGHEYYSAHISPEPFNFKWRGQTIKIRIDEGWMSLLLDHELPFSHSCYDSIGFHVVAGALQIDDPKYRLRISGSSPVFDFEVKYAPCYGIQMLYAHSVDHTQDQLELVLPTDTLTHFRGYWPQSGVLEKGIVAH